MKNHTEIRMRYVQRRSLAKYLGGLLVGVLVTHTIRLAIVMNIVLLFAFYFQYFSQDSFNLALIHYGFFPLNSYAVGAVLFEQTAKVLSKHRRYYRQRKGDE